MSLDLWLVFVALWIACALPLGPNAANTMQTSAAHGFRKCLWNVAGILAAAFVHMTATVVGLATVLLAHPVLFQALKLGGAIYLIWMGIRLWRRRDGLLEAADHVPASARRIFQRAVLISLSNPKSIFAYAAVFSQFVHAGEPLGPQLAILVPTAQAITGAVYLGYAALGLGVGRLLATARRRLAFNRGIGSFYILAGLGLATGSTSAAAPRPA